MIRRLQKFWRPETGIFLCLWLGLMIAGRSGLFHDPGTFWHTVVGEQMLESRRPIYTDSFSFTFAGQPWLAHQWLGECVMAVVHHLDGLDSLLLVTAIILASLYTWVARRLIHSGMHWSLAVVFVALTIAASSSHFHIRPHIVTIVCLGCTFAFLCDFEAGRIRTSRLFWLAPVFVLWANVHGGMLGGLCTLGLAVAGWFFARVVGLPSPIRQYRQLLALGALLLICGLAAFVNPYGWRLPWTWLSIMDSPILPQIIQEHAPLNPLRPDGWMVLVLGLIYLIALAGVLPKWPRVTWLIPLVWLYLACSRIRHAPLFAIMATLGLADMLPQTRWFAWLARTSSDWFRLPHPEGKVTKTRIDWRPMLLPVTLFLGAVVLQTNRLPIPVLGHAWMRLDPTDWPVELLPELTRMESRASQPTAIFNEYRYGGFLIYYTPDYRVFVDDRCELYGDHWLLDYVRAEEHDTAEHIRQWEREYRQPHSTRAFDLALTQTGSGFDRYFRLSRHWVPIKQTPTASLYQHKAALAPLARTSP